MIRSPLNYTGGKYRLLPQILPFLSSNILIDVFCGGLNVGINSPCRKLIAIDSQPQIIQLYQHWKSIGSEKAVQEIDNLVFQYGLSKTNQDGYLRLREDYNRSPWASGFYALVAHSFNHQIRFGRGFNMPFGKDRSSFNPTLRKRLYAFVDGLQRDVEFICGDFTLAEDIEGMIYCDPPYLVAGAAYNIGWTEVDDLRLMNMLDKRKFCLSNALSHGDKENVVLREWAKKYSVHHLSINYGNCSYHKKDRGKTEEVLIVS